MDIQENLRVNLKFFRTQKGMTQAQLAEKAGLSTRLIGGIECNCNKITLQTLECICNALEISPYLLIEPKEKVLNVLYLKTFLIDSLENFEEKSGETVKDLVTRLKDI